jgi:hypothetical protein
MLQMSVSKRFSGVNTSLLEEVQRALQVTETELTRLRRKTSRQRERFHEEKLAWIAAAETQVPDCRSMISQRLTVSPHSL